MAVFVLNQHGEALMPCKESKARKLLQSNKATIIKYQPFTIQLLHGSSGHKQRIDIGIDLGAKHIGVAMVSERNILAKGEIELRQNVKSLIDTRRSYRRGRRSRNLRYRQPRFLNRTKKKGWLPPSIQSRIDNTFTWIDRFMHFVPNPTITIEVGKFDIAKMINPDIKGAQYQEGASFGYFNTRYFVFARDNYTCQLCKAKNVVLQQHHIKYKSMGGTDKASNLITLCTECHTYENHKEGQILFEWATESKYVKQYKEGPFMNSFRLRVFDKYPNANITYGSTTTPLRKELGLEKTHYNDAIAITGVRSIKKNSDSRFFIKQFRKKKRSLHEATARKGRKVKNTTSKRNAKNTMISKGFRLNDKVFIHGQVGFISSFSGKAGARVKNITGEYIKQSGKNYTQVNLSNCQLLCHNNNWQYVHSFK